MDTYGVVSGNGANLKETPLVMHSLNMNLPPITTPQTAYNEALKNPSTLERITEKAGELPEAIWNAAKYASNTVPYMVPPVAAGMYFWYNAKDTDPYRAIAEKCHSLKTSLKNQVINSRAYAFVADSSITNHIKNAENVKKFQGIWQERLKDNFDKKWNELGDGPQLGIGFLLIGGIVCGIHEVITGGELTRNLIQMIPYATDDGSEIITNETATQTPVPTATATPEPILNTIPTYVVDGTITVFDSKGNPHTFITDPNNFSKIFGFSEGVDFGITERPYGDVLLPERYALLVPGHEHTNLSAVNGTGFANGDIITPEVPHYLENILPGLSGTDVFVGKYPFPESIITSHDSVFDSARINPQDGRSFVVNGMDPDLLEAIQKYDGVRVTRIPPIEQGMGYVFQQNGTEPPIVLNERPNLETDAFFVSVKNNAANLKDLLDQMMGRGDGGGGNGDVSAIIDDDDNGGITN